MLGTIFPEEMLWGHGKVVIRRQWAFLFQMCTFDNLIMPKNEKGGDKETMNNPSTKLPGWCNKCPVHQRGDCSCSYFFSTWHQNLQNASFEDRASTQLSWPLGLSRWQRGQLFCGCHLQLSCNLCYIGHGRFWWYHVEWEFHLRFHLSLFGYEQFVSTVSELSKRSGLGIQFQNSSRCFAIKLSRPTKPRHGCSSKGKVSFVTCRLKSGCLLLSPTFPK